MTLYAVIPTYNRPQALRQCLESACPQFDEVLVINNGDMPVVPDPPNVTVLMDGEQPPNLSRLWNVGLDWAQIHATRNTPGGWWGVAVLNDDAILPLGWAETVAKPLQTGMAVASCTGPVNTPVVHRHPGTTNLHERLTGYAYMLSGPPGVRADVGLRWWCGDNDIDMASRVAGGTVVLPNPQVTHLYPDQSTRGELAAQAQRDMAAFVEKWGFRPW